MQAQIVVIQLQHIDWKLPYTMELAWIEVFATAKFCVQTLREEQDRVIRAFVEGIDYSGHAYY